MQIGTIRRALLAITVIMGLIGAGGPESFAQPITPGVPGVPGEIQGFQLDPSTYGPGVVESMEVVLARDAARPVGEMTNPKGRNGAPGAWQVPSRRATYFPHSGVHNLTNKWGDTVMGITFPQPTDVKNVWVAGQGGQGSWTTALRVTGFRNGEQIGVTDWFREVGNVPKLFAINLDNVDRIVIQALPVVGGAGWYALDDLSFAAHAAAGQAITTIDFEDCNYGQTLTGSGYKGMNWETGAGEFSADQAIPGPINRLEREPGEPQQDEGGVAGGGGTTPILGTNFAGVARGDLGQGSFPPDTCGAIGPSHFVEVVNTNFVVFDRVTGARVVNSTLGSFLPGGSGDPRVLYDQHSGRWIVMDTNFSNLIFLAVSLTNNAAGSFFKTSFLCGANPDYPTLGVDANGIYIAAAIGGSMSIFALDKVPLIAGVPSLGAVTAFNGLPFEGAIQPCHTYGAATGEFLVSRFNSNGMRVRRVNPPLNAPTLTEVGVASIPAHALPADVPAMGSATALDVIDSRFMNAVYRNGFIYTAHTIDVSGRAAVRWYKLNSSGLALTDSGTIDDPIRHYFFPSIAVNSLGDLVLGFSGSSPTQFAAAYYTGRVNGDAAGQTGVPALLKAGTSSYQLLDNFGRNRYGDYSLTSLDPADELAFWTIQEWPAGASTWSTWIGKLTLSTVPANNDCAAATVAATGSTPFTSVNATTDGPDETGCGFLAPTQIGNDVWFKWVTSCTGTATMSLCGASFNTRMAVYFGCPTMPGQMLACNDNFCGPHSQVTFPCTLGQLLRIRIGGAGGITGTGTLVISCTPAPVCPADVNNSGSVNIDDLVIIITNWGAAGGIADINDDNIVNIDDLVLVITNWGPC